MKKKLKFGSCLYKSKHFNFSTVVMEFVYLSVSRFALKILYSYFIFYA